MVELKNILSLIFSDVAKIKIKPIEEGLINTTFKIQHPQHGNFILQKVNHTVFKNPVKVNDNISKLSNFLKNSSYRLNRIELLDSQQGHPTVLSGGGYWRMAKFLNGKSIELAENTDTVRNAGMAFGHFISSLAGFDPKELHVPIEGFLDFQGRFSDFEKSISINFSNRSSQSGIEIDFLIDQKNYLFRIINKLKSCPNRIIHGDPKISNIIFNLSDNTPLAIIDWDTCTPGPILYDYSDMVRSYINPVHEDDPNVEKINLDPLMFQALTDGFLSEVEPIITREEKELLREGAGFVTFIQAIRFLTDYLKGDIYYKTSYTDHNLIRTRNQIALFRSIQEFI